MTLSAGWKRMFEKHHPSSVFYSTYLEMAFHPFPGPMHHDDFLATFVAPAQHGLGSTWSGVVCAHPARTHCSANVQRCRMVSASPTWTPWMSANIRPYWSTSKMSSRRSGSLITILPQSPHPRFQPLSSLLGIMLMAGSLGTDLEWDKSCACNIYLTQLRVAAHISLCMSAANSTILGVRCYLLGVITNNTASSRVPGSCSRLPIFRSIFCQSKVDSASFTSTSPSSSQPLVWTIITPRKPSPSPMGCSGNDVSRRKLYLKKIVPY